MRARVWVCAPSGGSCTLKATPNPCKKGADHVYISDLKDGALRRNLVKGGSLINRGTLKLAAVSTLELENPVGFDNSKGRIETSGKIKINDSGLTEAQQQAPQDIDMGDIRLSGADAMLLSWDKGYTLSTDKDKDKDKRKARVNFGSVELLDGAHFSQSKNALDSGDSMTIGKGAKMDVAGLSTWQTVTLKVGCCFRRCACKL